jgi:hypothetical protein
MGRSAASSRSRATSEPSPPANPCRAHRPRNHPRQARMWDAAQGIPSRLSGCFMAVVVYGVMEGGVPASSPSNTATGHRRPSVSLPAPLMRRGLDRQVRKLTRSRHRARADHRRVLRSQPTGGQLAPATRRRTSGGPAPTSSRRTSSPRSSAPASPSLPRPRAPALTPRHSATTDVRGRTRGPCGLPIPPARRLCNWRVRGAGKPIRRRVAG